jgi:hypothetical protein
VKRREFMALLGGAAAACPLAVQAQQQKRMRRVGALMSQGASDEVAQVRYAAFLQGLQHSGWEVGRNLRVDTRWTGGSGSADRMRESAAELAALAPDVILATGSAATGPLLQATRSVPIVFVHTPDPVGAGFVSSMSRPGGNATGFINFEYAIGAGLQTWLFSWLGWNAPPPGGQPMISLIRVVSVIRAALTGAGGKSPAAVAGCRRGRSEDAPARESRQASRAGAAHGESRCPHINFISVRS